MSAKEYAMKKLKNLFSDPYNFRIAGSAVALSGVFLYIEHIYRFGLDFSDPLGHDWVGLALIVLGGLITRIKK